MRTIAKFLSAAAAVVIGTAAAASAQAAVIIGLGASPVAVADSDPSPDNAVFTGSSGVFSFNVVSGTSGVLPFLLQSQTLNTTASGAGTLDIWITRTDITDAAPGFLSGFTTNFLPADWTVAQETYVDTANGQFSGALAGSTVFTGAPGLQTDSDLFKLAVSGPYSVTHHYTINATGAGSNNSTISLQAVPEPGTWALMILGFGAAGAMLRSRRRAMAFA